MFDGPPVFGTFFKSSTESVLCTILEQYRCCYVFVVKKALNFGALLLLW